MKVDLQALIDMPGAGNARKALVKAGKWNPFLTDTERMDWLDSVNVRVKVQGYDLPIIKHNRRKHKADLRQSINTAATAAGMNQ